MKQLFAIVALAVILGTMYGYVLGRLEFGPPPNSRAPVMLASEYPTFLLGGNFWEKIIFWSAPPLFALFAWLTITFVGQTYLRDQKARLHERTISDMGDLFRKVSSLLHQKSGSNGNSHGPER